MVSTSEADYDIEYLAPRQGKRRTESGQNSSPHAYRFSVIMPTWNRGPDLRKAVTSVLRQSFDDFELLIIDDHSDIPAAEFLQGLTDSNAVACVRLKRNMGVSAARNVGIALARGEYLAFLDDDDEYLPEKLSLIHKAIDERKPDLLYHKMRMVFTREGLEYTNNPTSSNFSYQDLLLKNLIGSPSMVVVRREAVLAVGGFDTSLPALEDYELWLRLLRNGSRFEYLDAVLTNYYRHTERSSRSHSVKNDVLAWHELHERYRDDYEQMSDNRWNEHLQKIELYRAFRCLLGYRRIQAARYFLSSYLKLPTFSSVVLLLAALTAVLSPTLCLLLQARFKRSAAIKSLFFPVEEQSRAT